jgi:hypothetical protein
MSFPGTPGTDFTTRRPSHVSDEAAVFASELAVGVMFASLISQPRRCLGHRSDGVSVEIRAPVRR